MDIDKKNNKALQKASDDWNKRVKQRLASGEAHMFCGDCGAKLYSFDGYRDSFKKCPYMKNGKCEPPRSD